MSMLEGVWVALQGLAANKMRSALTMLGIIIGISSAIILVSVGQGVQQSVGEEIQGIGSNLIFILPGNVGEAQKSGRSSFLRTVGTSSLTYEDTVALRDTHAVPNVVGVAAEFVGYGKVVWGNKNHDTSINGVTPAYEDVRNFHAQFGDFISNADVTNQARVCVLGRTVARKLFPPGVSPIGQTVKINRVSFRVIGLMEEKGGSSFGDEDDVVFVPLSTAHTRLFQARDVSGDYTVSIIYVAIADESFIDQTRADIAQLLRQRHGIFYQGEEDDFSIITQSDVISVLGNLTAMLTLFLGLISIVSLVVGGIGIMNIMLVSVTERTREIGIRKAVGAKRRDILVQFLLEAMMLGLIGGCVGILLGIVGSRTIGEAVANLATRVSWDTILIATGFSMAVGLFFGIYPAARASNLHPIDALRYE